MNMEELNEARKNPDFLVFLQEKENNALKEQSIKDLYEVLDTLLVLDINEENRINKVYEEILKIAFNNIEKRLQTNKKLTLEDDDFYYIRSFYEHAIEKWSLENFDGAKELFFILSQIVEDKRLQDSFNIHMISCAKNITMDDFYDTKVDTSKDNDDEKYGYFITYFKFDTNKYLDEHKENIEKEYKNMEHLLR